MKANRILGQLLLCYGMLAGAQTLQQTESQTHKWGYLAVSADPRWKAVSAEEASQLEQQLRSDPEDAEIRAKLLNYYWQNNMRPERADSVCWLIEHHPESVILGLDIAWITPQSDGADFDRARVLWESSLNPIAFRPEALHNAARFFETSNLDKSVELARRLQTLDPAGHTKLVANFYGMVLSGGLGSPHGMDHLVTSLPLLEDLAHSPEVNLVGSTATELVTLGAQAALHKTTSDISFVCLAAFQLLGRARQLEPQNSEWTDLLEGAKRLPCVSIAPPQVTVNPTPGTRPGAITVGGAVQAAHLVGPVAPDYPSAARQAGIEGVVKCRIRIGVDGHVIDVSVLSGDPLLVPPAIEAVKQYVYNPTLLNGNAVEVETTVDIPFQAN